MKYEVVFEDYNYKKTSYGIVDTKVETQDLINKILNEKNYHPYYLRRWRDNDKEIIDFGSHSEFIYIYFLEE